MNIVIYVCMMKLILFGSGELNVDKTNELNVMEYDCLDYYINREKLAYQQLLNVINDKIEYCFRPFHLTKRIFEEISLEKEESMTFEELRQLNVSSEQLFLWSCPIDIIEEYEYYLITNDSLLSNKIYNNCTKGWFGTNCQYSFGNEEDFSFINFVENDYSNRLSNKDSPELLNEFPCYIHLKCVRNGKKYCLDWREICNGRIECSDDGIDELNCFEMERNECLENEYRCHNGLCISDEFWEGGEGESDCLDRSDEYSDVFYPHNCYKDPSFRCEEHSCRPNWYDYPCGDGQCVQFFHQCHNGRHHLLVQSTFIEENILNNCSLAILCLMKVIHEMNGILCESILINEYIDSYCDSLIQFPSNPIYFDHIRLLYEKNSLKSELNSLIIPDYICYNNELCDCLNIDIIYKNLTCLNSSRLEIIFDGSENIWIDLILSINSYFSCCLISNELIKDSNETSLYKCLNSSKLISINRLNDENKDCCLGDDEDNDLTCSINSKHKIRCLNEKKCLSSLHTIDDCSSNQINKIIPYPFLCDGLVEYLHENETDESECELWPCNNMYTRCDGFSSCLNGEDEFNCYEDKKCLNGEHECISLTNYSFICLSNEKVNDGINDCLGSTDELEFCRRNYPSKKDSKRFRCQNSDICLSTNQLCDQIPSCPFKDDEFFCQSKHFICDQQFIFNRSIIEQVICRLDQHELNRLIHFSIHTSHNYPSFNSPNDENLLLINQNKTNEQINSVRNGWKQSSNRLWYCNRGLVVHILNESEMKCLCPPSYYGERCEYENERVSLTLGLIRYERNEVYQIIILLISLFNQSEQIESFQEYEYVSNEICSIKINRYLLYSQRPKDQSKMYFIRIHVIEKHSMRYRGSWFLSIPFLFLPVNRLSNVIYIPSKELSYSSNCLNKCYNGECIQYLNKDLSYCRCSSGWSGIECDIEINCSLCSSDSLCLGKSICICPLMKFGKRCLIKKSSCERNSCENNGECIPSGLNSFNCICSDDFYGKRCEFEKNRIEIELEYLNIPSYFLTYFIEIKNGSDPIITILIEKLTLFQRIVNYQISINYNIILIKSDDKYYLALLQQIARKSISTKINPSRECLSIEYLLNSTILNKSRYKRMKFYHLICSNNDELNCFKDEYYLCLCTKDRHANCFQFNFNENFQCLSNKSCLNNGICLQDDPKCPSSIICVCKDCFFGNQCQFYAKGLGLTLDEILTYEIQSNLSLSKQNFSVKLTGFITMLMFIIGLINNILSILTFKRKMCCEVGCGIYLLTSSIISLLIVFLFTFKYWFLLFSFQKFFGQNLLISLNCFLIEPLIKIFLNIENWLNSCVAIERAFAVFKGIYFQKNQSKLLSKWIILFVILINLILFLPQIIHLNLFYEKKEERTWCGILYSSLLNSYQIFFIYFHFLTPFIINIVSSAFIIIGTAYQRLILQNNHQFSNHFKAKLKQHKHLLISPCILIIFSLPRLIMSFTLNCKKSSEEFWYYLFGYFVSYIPSVMIFIIFVFPSPIYKKEFKQVLLNIQDKFSFKRTNSLTNKRC